MRRQRLVRGGRPRKSVRMRMVIAHHLRPAIPRRAMRIDQGLRIDFEMRLRSRVDIGGGLDRGDARAPAKQDAATFAGVGCGGFCT